jgi:L-threonylcarbamoyladenylate synthase
MPEMAVKVLEKGGVLIMPCDTIYGFVGKYPDSDGTIREIKGRGETKPFLVLSTESMIDRLSDQEIPEYLKKYWPGPLTLIIKGKSPGTSIAVRVPDDPVLLHLMESIDAPVFSTSVNRSGRPPLNKIEEIAGEFEFSVDMLVDGGDIEGGRPSTIVDVTSRPFKVLRQGSLLLDL